MAVRVRMKLKRGEDYLPVGATPKISKLRAPIVAIKMELVGVSSRVIPHPYGGKVTVVAYNVEEARESGKTNEYFTRITRKDWEKYYTVKERQRYGIDLGAGVVRDSRGQHIPLSGAREY